MKSMKPKGVKKVAVKMPKGMPKMVQNMMRKVK